MNGRFEQVYFLSIPNMGHYMRIAENVWYKLMDSSWEECNSYVCDQLEQSMWAIK